MRGCALLAALALGACTGLSITEGEEALVAAPPDCDRAEAQIAELEAIRPTGAREAGAAASVIGVAGLATAAATGTIDDRERLAGGSFRAEVDARIALIRETCGLPLPV